jgi:prepilin-type N-terminal cleavage/methylation domain-containing protein
MAAPHRSSRGFTLVEILIVVVILGLVMAMAAVLLRSITAAQKRSVTNTRLANIEAAIVQFVMLQKRLPCPADGTISAGTEIRNPGQQCNPGNQQNGVVPWVTLGISPADAMDGWDRRFTYRAATELVRNNGMDLSACDPAGTGGLAGTVCNGACTSSALGNCTPPVMYVTGKGLSIRNVAGATMMDAAGTTGAAYVLISHGESGGGGLLDTGVLASSSSTDGAEEQKNYANQVLQGYYVDDQLAEAAGATHFDDLVLRPSLISVATKAGLGPRSH